MTKKEAATRIATYLQRFFLENMESFTVGISDEGEIIARDPEDSQTCDMLIAILDTTQETVSSAKDEAVDNFMDRFRREPDWNLKTNIVKTFLEEHAIRAAIDAHNKQAGAEFISIEWPKE